MQNLESLALAFAEEHPDGFARSLNRMGPADAARVIRNLPARVLGPVMERITPEHVGAILACAPAEQAAEILAAMPRRHGARSLHFLPEDKREPVLAILPGDVNRELGGILKYPIESAGGMMDPRVLSLPVDISVQQALSLLRAAPRERVHYLYVVDRSQKLVGVVGMRDLILAPPKSPMAPLVIRKITSVPAGMDREEVAAVMRSLHYFALPVVDAEGHLLGVVKHEDVLETIQEEAFEDLQKMVGAGGDEQAQSPVGVKVRKRLPWLLVNLGTAFLAAGVVSLFEGTLARMAVLAVLLPIVAGQAGNTGAQALAVVIRGLALREVFKGTRGIVVLRELAAGAISGAAVAAVTGGCVYAWLGQPKLALVIALSMFLSMGIACLAGVLIPLGIQALKRDPAQSSTIFLTTVTDSVGLGSFLGLASLMLF